ncbi:chromatin-remodeling protein [Hanseniaspora uvarum]|nr:chromatin-remodeling protein [Hanseniaspora uvarum]
MSVEIDEKKCIARLEKLHANLSNFQESPECLLFPLGSSNPDLPFQKTTLLHKWLFGYEFPATLVFLHKSKVIIITSSVKATHLKFLEDVQLNGNTPIEFWKRINKNTEFNVSLFKKLVDLINDDICLENKNVGMLLKDKYDGPFIKEWNPVWEEGKKGLNVLDASLGLSKVLENKDEYELDLLNASGKSSDTFMKTLTKELIKCIDNETKITNAKLSDRIESKIDDSLFMKELNTALKSLNYKTPGFKPDVNDVEFTYSPIIQSEADYDLKLSASSTNKQLKGKGAILASCGLNYKGYCSNSSRTFLIDPTTEMSENYEFLLSLQQHIIEKLLKIGSYGKDIYEGCIKFIEEQGKSDLIPSFSKNCGSLIGLDFRDSQFILSAKNDFRTVQANDVFNISIGLNNLESKEINYALQLSDTVAVLENGEIQFLTQSPKAKGKVTFLFNDDEEEEARKAKIKAEQLKQLELVNQTTGKLTRSRLRNQSKDSEESNKQRIIRRENQVKLHKKLQRDGLLKYSDKGDGDGAGSSGPVFKKYESYVREEQIPVSVRDLKIHVDFNHQTIIIPIYGRPVPFHINTYKSCSKDEEGDYTYLRLNFHSPNAPGSAKKTNELPYEDSPENHFMRSLTVRSKDKDRMDDVHKEILELKKLSTKREQEKKAMEGVIKQAKLIEFKTGKLKKLDHIYIRPSPEIKRVPGTLTIHENGLRYNSFSKSDSKVDIVYSNIKNLFFQSSKGELVVIIHVHLKNPILMGKKKVQDLQFYREATDMVVDETSSSRRGAGSKFRRYGDDDEIEEEREEKRRRALLDKEFKNFAALISEASDGLVDLEEPIRELGFQGVPGRSAVQCMPTGDCLVQLMEPPFMVINLEDVEICCLERVQFGLKNFDLVFIYKDFNRPVSHINTIPMEDIETIKNWLTNVDIAYTVSTINLNWTNILKTDPHDFFSDGGWAFLPVGSDVEAENSDMSEEEVSEFEPESDDAFEEEDDDAGSEYSENSEFEAEESDFSPGESESEGEDWDALEKKAAKSDRASEYKD